MTFTIDGIALADDKCRAVLAWEKDPCAWPYCLRVMHGSVVLHPEGIKVTPDLIDRIRDHVMPWTEVRRDEVELGEEYRFAGETGPTYIAGYDIGYIHLDWSYAAREPLRCAAREPVIVRRPRKPALTLGDLEPGQRFVLRVIRSADLVNTRTNDGYVTPDWVHVPAVDAPAGLDTPVELVDE